MKLEQYRQEQKLTYRALGKLLGVDGSMAYRWCSGAMTPLLVRAYEIERRTKGKVKAADFDK